jgi:hypothetical protein
MPPVEKLKLSSVLKSWADNRIAVNQISATVQKRPHPANVWCRFTRRLSEGEAMMANIMMASFEDRRKLRVSIAEDSSQVRPEGRAKFKFERIHHTPGAILVSCETLC